MSRRTSWRIPIRMDVKCFRGDRECPGTITNLSENGMFINTEGICFPEDSQFQVRISLKEEDLDLPVKLNRSVNTEGHCSMGVEILDPSGKYNDFVENLMRIMYI
jgi:hypothetical protein